MTSSPPSSHLAVAVRPESPALPAGNWTQGLRSLWHLSRHLTARADDNHAAPRHPSVDYAVSIIELNHMFLRLCGPPSIPLSFSLAAVLPRWMTYRFPSTTHPITGQTASHHRLRRGLPGYLILFDPHAFVPQRRSRIRGMPSQSVFCVISMHFTATPHIPPAACVSQAPSINGSPRVEPGYFTADLSARLRTL